MPNSSAVWPPPCFPPPAPRGLPSPVGEAGSWRLLWGSRLPHARHRPGCLFTSPPPQISTVWSSLGLLGLLVPILVHRPLPILVPTFENRLHSCGPIFRTWQKQHLSYSCSLAVLLGSLLEGSRRDIESNQDGVLISPNVNRILSLESITGALSALLFEPAALTLLGKVGR